MAGKKRWVAASKLSLTDEGVDAQEAACRVLPTLVCVDQLNPISLEAAELVARQLQLVEGRHRSKGQQQQAQDVDSHLYIGSSSSSRGGAFAAPEPQGWIAEEVREEAAVLKERRKARAERGLQIRKK